MKRLSKMVLGLGLLVQAAPAFAQSASIAPGLRAAIIKKVISYDRTLANAPVSVVIYHAQSGSSEAQELQSALDRVGLASTTATSEDELKRRDVKVLYVLADDAPANIRAYCKQAHCLSMTSSMQAVEQGEASVAISALNGKPQLAVHMRRLGDERQDLSAEMLQLARVIR
jgi:hypothetical protein